MTAVSMYLFESKLSRMDMHDLDIFRCVVTRNYGSFSTDPASER